MVDWKVLPFLGSKEGEMYGTMASIISSPLIYMVTFDLLGLFLKPNKEMSACCWLSMCLADKLKHTLYRLIRKRFEVAQPRFYTATFRDVVALTPSSVTDVR